MAFLSGNGAKVLIGTSTGACAEIDKWTLNTGANLQDTASFNDTWEEKGKALLKWSGTISGRMDNTDTNGHVALRTAVLAGNSVTVKLYEDSTHYYSGTAFLELSHDADESAAAQTASYSFTGSGALSYT